MTHAASPPVLVCFGDSLTAGYQVQAGGGMPLPDAPYGAWLQQWLKGRGQVHVKGICGELTADMVTRFSRDVIELSPSLTVILGGTNDLGWGVSPAAIIENLERLYAMASAAGIQPVGVTVPSIRVEEPGWESSSTVPPPAWLHSHIQHRVEVNRLIKKQCQGHRMPCVDLFEATSETPHQLLAAQYSSDGLHLSAAGYAKFAELVWTTVFADRFGPCPV